MNVLLLQPHTPDSFWGFQNFLKFLPYKAMFPCLGLLTVAAMLPPEWPLKLVDLNVEPLTEEQLAWADLGGYQPLPGGRSQSLCRRSVLHHRTREG